MQAKTPHGGMSLVRNRKETLRREQNQQVREKGELRSGVWGALFRTA